MKRIIKIKKRRVLGRRNYIIRCMSRNIHPKYKLTPSLYLCGDWMKEAGFNVNDHVLLTMYPQKLVIRPVKNEEDTRELFEAVESSIV